MLRKSVPAGTLFTRYRYQRMDVDFRDDALYAAYTLDTRSEQQRWHRSCPGEQYQCMQW